jgi:hypothetical protein
MDNFCVLCKRAPVTPATGNFGAYRGCSFGQVCWSIFKAFLGTTPRDQFLRALSIERDCIRLPSGRFEWAADQKRYLLVDLNPGLRRRPGAFVESPDDIKHWFSRGNLCFQKDYYIVDPTSDEEMAWLFSKMEDLPDSAEFTEATRWWSDKFVANHARSTRTRRREWSSLAIQMKRATKKQLPRH